MRETEHDVVVAPAQGRLSRCKPGGCSMHSRDPGRQPRPRVPDAFVEQGANNASYAAGVAGNDLGPRVYEHRQTDHQAVDGEGVSVLVLK